MLNSLGHLVQHRTTKIPSTPLNPLDGGLRPTRNTQVNSEKLKDYIFLSVLTLRYAVFDMLRYKNSFNLQFPNCCRNGTIAEAGQLGL